MAWSKYEGELRANAAALCAPGKGLLAADESTGTIGKRFTEVGVENTEVQRRAYRDLLFAPSGLSEHISGVILYEETFNQKALACDTPFPALLQAKGVIPGIKVDKGTTPIPGTDGETATLGLDGLLERCQKFYEGGARFAKWRAVLSINKAKGHPSARAIAENAHGLARYAAICQQAGLVPIVEPEILMDGAHPIEECAAAAERVLVAVYAALALNGVLLEGTLLKPNMITAGSEYAGEKSIAEVAAYTVRTLRRAVPPAVPGIMFLSGGQSEEDASAHLNALNTPELKARCPWALSFSFGRALQASVLREWRGKPEAVPAAQAALLVRAKANGEAQLGTYKGGAGGAAASASLAVKGYVY